MNLFSCFPGSGCSAVGGALPGLIGTTGSSVMMKPFLSFPVETIAPSGLFPNLNTVCHSGPQTLRSLCHVCEKGDDLWPLCVLQMDPVQKAIIKHTFGVTMVPKKKHVISCHVCQLKFNSGVSSFVCFSGISQLDSSNTCSVKRLKQASVTSCHVIPLRSVCLPSVVLQSIS